MKGAIFAIAFFIIAISCRQHSTVQQQLQAALKHRLQRIDTTANLDSVHIIWNIPATQKLGTIIDDTFYLREYARIKSQLAAAAKNNEKDSVEFYQYEINYMEKEIDSISKAIAKADTTRLFGRLIGCSYFVSANNKTRTDTAFIFVDSTMTIRSTEFVDSALHRTVLALR
ncbi:MAG: hypothetical protein C5B59_08890 [Bacteroidetes bacterium]|nr:MAG: hypothetical protein C5B59_08890 [Bacteroidota bacterium]